MKRLGWSLVWAAILVAVALGGGMAWDIGPAAAAPAYQMPSPVAPDHTEVISRALIYLAEQQAADGGLLNMSGSSDEFSTIKGVVALAALGRPQDTLAHPETGKTLVDFLRVRAVTYTRDLTGTVFPARVGMLAVGVVAAEADPYDFAGVDWVEALQGTFHPATGAYSSTASSGWSTGAANTVNQVWAILGCTAAQASVPAEAVDFLLSLQEADGGWGYGFGGDTDTTGLALQALMASGHITPEHPAIVDALRFLRARQDDRGSWGYIFNDVYTASPDSTASVIQALVALGYTPATETWHVSGGGNPHSALVAMHAEDGSFSANALGTAHALAGLAEAPLPLWGRRQRAHLALTALADAQNADGSWRDFGAPSPGATADAVLAFASAGFAPPPTALDYLVISAPTYAGRSPDTAGKLLMAVVAAGENPEQFAGLNLMDKVQGYYSATLGAFGDPTNVWHQAMAILGLAAAGEPVPVTATATLRTLQQANGGWGYSAAWDLATADNTALAMQALAAAGEPLSSTAMVSATAFLRATQDTAGGWDNANTTAFAIQGLVAAGEDVQASKWRRGGRTPVAALEDYQKPDGPFRFGMADSAFATRQAVPALLGLAFPVAQPDGTLSPWQPVVRGPDPDRLVVGRLRYDAETRTLVVPFGSDWDGDAQATVTWLLGDARAAVAFRMLRGTHRFTATLPMRGVRVYDAYVQATDSQGVQGGTVQRLRNRWRSVGPRALNDRGLRIASLCWID